MHNQLIDHAEGHSDIASDTYEIERNEESTLEAFLKAENTGSKKDHTLESFADSTLAWGFAKYEAIVDKGLATNFQNIIGTFRYAHR